LGVFELVSEEQFLVKHGGSEFDVLTVHAKDSADEFDLYFNVDIPMRWLANHLSPGLKKKRPAADGSS
jgi:hypothetical protein